MDKKVSMNKGRVLFLVLSLMLSSFSASAQLFKTAYGVTGGSTSTVMHTELKTTQPMTMGYYGGAFATVNFTDEWSVRMGANYATQGAHYQLYKTKIRLQQSYLNIPVEFMYNLKSYLSVEAGFYQNVLLGSSLTENGQLDLVISPDSGAMPYNIGVLAGFSFTIARTVFINFRYNYGLNKSYVIYGKGYPMSSLTLGLGINLVKIKKSVF